MSGSQHATSNSRTLVEIGGIRCFSRVFFFSILVDTQYYVSFRHVCLLSRFSRVRLLATLWTTAHQAPLSMGFSRREYWSGFPCPPPGDLPTRGSNPHLMLPALAVGLFNTRATWEAQLYNVMRLVPQVSCVQSSDLLFKSITKSSP